MRTTKQTSLHRSNKDTIRWLFIGLLLLTPFFIYYGAMYWVDVIQSRHLAQVRSALTVEHDVVLSKTQKMVGEGAIDRYITANDQANTADILSELTQKYGLTVTVAANAEGVALARVPSPRTGDYVLQTTAWGRRAALGQSVVTMSPSRNFPYTLIAAVPLMRDDVVSGALIGGYILDNAYAQQFRDRYTPGIHVAFFEKEAGVVSSSFADEDVREQVMAYFSQGSDWVNGIVGSKNKLLQVGDVSYRVGSVRVDGLDGASGGVIIFMPINRPYLIMLGALIEILLFLLCAYILWRITDKDTRRILIIVLSIVFVAIIFAGVYEYFSRRFGYDIRRPEYGIYNATMEIVPDSDIFHVGSTGRVAIQVTSGGEEINAVEAHLDYDPAVIQVRDILMTRSFCDSALPVKKDINNELGTVSIACASLTGHKTGGLILADLLIDSVAVGATSFAFTDTTKVLAHDGLGTNVLRATTNGTYRVIDRSAVTQDRTTLVFSHTHPNAIRWYAKRDIGVSWLPVEGAQRYRYVLDQSASTVGIDETYTTHELHTNITIEDDGVYYFHVQPVFADGSVGTVSHHRIAVDSTVPSVPSIKASSTVVASGDVVRFSFSGYDGQSGMQKNFYIKFDNGIWLPTQDQLYIPFFDTGKHQVSLRTFDNAGNFTDASVEIQVVNKL